MRRPFGLFTSVRRKLFAGALLTSLAALFVAAASLFAYDLHSYRESSSASLEIEARLFGRASTAALQFRDPVVAAENLAFLRARPTVRAAATYRPDGKVFATYVRGGVDRTEVPPAPRTEGVRIDGARVEVFHRILDDREFVGTVYLAEDLELGERVASYAAIAVAVTLAALVVSAAISAWLQQGITRPIIEISGVAQAVVKRRDYTVRATRTTDDEIGTLVDAFNEMLAEIQRRTAALESSSAEVGRLNQDLERRVGERTAQLEESNLQLIEASRAKSSFLSMMSHEIRTPMNGVLGMLELLSLSELEHHQRRTLSIVRDSSRSLLRIIDDILDFSKIEAGKLEVRPEAASIARIVQSVTGIHSGNASSKGLVLKSSVDPRLAPAHLVDPLRLQQILNNLVSNAIKFTSAGSVELRAELLERTPERQTLRILVCDTGAGISPEDRARLFQPFAQAGDAAVRQVPGTGLGLSISQRLAALMGGGITLDSRVGEGTVAALTLTLAVADPASLPADDEAADVAPLHEVVTSRRKAPSVAEAAAEGTLVLVVDDHPVNRLLLARQVSVLGYACETAENGREALERWGSGRFALVLTDCNMPEMDGYELAKAVRAREAGPGTAHTAIIACTANALAGEAENCLAAGMDDYIAKPVDLVRLAAILDRWLPLPEQAVAAPPAARPRDSAPPIDSQVLGEICDGDPELERELLEQLVRTSADDVAELGRAIASRDAAGVAQAAHRIKGSARAVGAHALGEAGANAEAAARAGDWAGIEAAHASLQTEAARASEYAGVRVRAMRATHG